MKKYFLLLALFFTFSIYAQYSPESPIPEKVLKSFTNEFSDLIQYKWSKVLYLEFEGKQELYEIEFLEKGYKMKVAYNYDGKKILTQKYIPTDDLPKGVLKYIKSNYNKFSIIQAFKILSNEDSYKVGITNKKDEYITLYFNAEGKFVFEYIGLQ